MLFDLINPSDHYTFKAESLECAALATTILGSGQYGAEQLDGDAAVPIFMTEQWFRENFGRSTQDSLDLYRGERLQELIACFDSVLIGNRDEYERTLPLIAADKRDEWTAYWHDQRRSSMNDIGRRAKRIAKALAENRPPEPAPRQIFMT
jgi:hypothetical protein